MRYLVILMLPFIVAFRWTTESKIYVFHSAIVAGIQDHGLSGPIAEEIAPYAQLRCIHEDGADRAHDVAYNGMVPGSPNKEVMQKLYMPDCTLGKVTANDGQGCYVIKGHKAHVMASVAIGLWYDEMVNRIGSREERKVWNESRHLSHMIALERPDPYYQERFECLKNRRENIIKRFNNMYGPQGQTINKNKERYFP